MDLRECIQFANENPVTYIATTDGDQPRVRAFAMWFADTTGFYYHTGTHKERLEAVDEEPESWNSVFLRQVEDRCREE